MKKRIDHELKVLPSFFHDILFRQKTFEYRLNDRRFKKGDVVLLKEWVDSEERFTGNWILVRIAYVLDSDKWPMLGEYCVFSWYWINTRYCSSDAFNGGVF